MNEDYQDKLEKCILALLAFIDEKLGEEYEGDYEALCMDHGEAINGATDNQDDAEISTPSVDDNVTERDTDPEAFQ